MGQVQIELWIRDEHEFDDIPHLQGMEWEDGITYGGPGWYWILANTKTREMWTAGPMDDEDRRLNEDPFDAAWNAMADEYGYDETQDDEGDGEPWGIQPDGEVIF
jgi:hypothetical protein